MYTYSLLYVFDKMCVQVVVGTPLKITTVI